MGRGPPELLGSGLATEPFGSGFEDMDVGSDVRDGGVPSGRIEGDGIGFSGRRIHPGEYDDGGVEPCVAGDCVFPVQPRRHGP